MRSATCRENLSGNKLPIFYYKLINWSLYWGYYEFTIIQSRSNKNCLSLSKDVQCIDWKIQSWYMKYLVNLYPALQEVMISDQCSPFCPLVTEAFSHLDLEPRSTEFSGKLSFSIKGHLPVKKPMVCRLIFQDPWLMRRKKEKSSIYPWKRDFCSGIGGFYLHGHEFHTGSFQDCCLLH